MPNNVTIHSDTSSSTHPITVTRTSTNTCNSVAIKNLVKTVKYLEILANIYSTTTGNVAHSCKCIASVYSTIAINAVSSC